VHFTDEEISPNGNVSVLVVALYILRPVIRDFARREEQQCLGAA